MASVLNLKDVKIRSDCFFAKSMAFRSENHKSFGYDVRNEGPTSQQVWQLGKRILAIIQCQASYELEVSGEIV
jgi:hypothetical protein